MKRVFKVLFLCGVLSAISGFSIKPKASNNFLPQNVLRAEEGEPTSETPISSEEPTSSEEEPISEPEIAKPCVVIIDKSEHGSLSVDINEGEIGDIVTVTAKHDFLYRVESVTVNGTALIESEKTSGLYQFALVEGENKLAAKFVVDEELCGDLSTIIKQASDKDWTNLFTLENVLTILKWLIDGGVLIAVIRYFVKDKKLADKIETTIVSHINDKMPDTVKKAVVSETKYVIEPMFNKMLQGEVMTRQCVYSMVKCMALMQQNTPESRLAILNELEKLNGVIDTESLADIKKYIQEAVADYAKAFEETLARLNHIGEQHQEVVDNNGSEEVKPVDTPTDNGSQI